MSDFAAAVFLAVLAATVGLAAVAFALIVRPARRRT
jgi:peptidoglycan/LPS O-acetylase OafA/YrhL